MSNKKLSSGLTLIKIHNERNIIKLLHFILFILVIFNFSLFLYGRKHEKCVTRTIDGIHFRYCVNKLRIERNESFELTLTVKIPNNREIYVSGKDIWLCGLSWSLDTLDFCLGNSNIMGDCITMLYDLKNVSRRGYYRYKFSVCINDIEKKFGVSLHGVINLQFLVSFSKKICEPLKNIILKQEWSHWEDRNQEWYDECYGDLFRNFVFDETVGTIRLTILE